MSETNIWTTLSGEGLSNFVIIMLVVINIVIACWAAMQRRRRTKLERDILAEKTFGNAARLASKRPRTNSAKLEDRTQSIVSEVSPVLKIDQAVKMIKSGYSLEETKSAIDIETAYLQIIAEHHNNN